MRTLISFILSVFLFICTSRGQKEADVPSLPIDTTGWHIYPDTTKARMMLDSLEDALKDAKSNRAFSIVDAFNFFTSNFDDPYYAQLHYRCGKILWNHGFIQKRIQQFLLAIDRIEKHPRQVDLTLQSYIYHALAVAYDQDGAYLDAKKMEEKSIQLKKSNPKVDLSDLIPSYNTYAVILKNLGNYNGAIHSYLNALNIASLTPKEAMAIYSNLGVVYAQLEDYENALNYINESIKIGKEYDIKKQLAMNYGNMANIYDNLGNEEEAIFYEEQTHTLFAEIFGVESMYYAISGANLAESYAEVGKWKDADRKFKSVGRVYEKILPDPHPYKCNFFENYSIYLDQTNKLDSSILFAQKCLTDRVALFGVVHPHTSNAYFRLYKLFKYKNDNTAAEYFIQSMEALSCWPMDSCVVSPSIAPQLLRLLKELLSDPPAVDFEYSTLLHLLAVSQDIMFSNIDSKRSKINFNKNAMEILSMALPVFYARDKTGTWTMLEKYKSRIMLSDEDYGEGGAGLIPDSYRQKIDSFEAKINYLEKKKFQEKYESKKPNDSMISTMENHLFDLKIEKDKFIKILKRDYPDYWNLRYNFEIASVRDVQNQLSKDQCFIEYFVGDTSLFTFVIRNDTFLIQEVTLPFSLEKWVGDLQNAILEMGLTPRVSHTSTSVFLQRSRDLYDLLIRPVSKSLTDRLIVVPDGPLGYLPFDVLLSEEVPSLVEAPYLVRNHTIAYQYSATLWLEMMKKRVLPTKEVLAYAPDFPPTPLDWKSIDTLTQAFATRDSLWKLTYSVEECKAINEYWKADMVVDSAANVQNFVHDVSDYRVVHLSTHGKADDRMGDYCYLAFTKTSDTLDHKLYVRDLYNIKLNADMVVLSACETGLGELQQGEGILSLARGFAYAGAKSIVSTLWAVNDESTKDIMASFYKHLRKGEAKDEALRNAKLEYLNENPGAPPFYWAAFTTVGDMSPLASTSTWWVWVVTLLGIFLLPFLFLRRIRRLTP